MKVFLVCMGIIGMLVSVATAQTKGREVYPEQASIEHNSAVKSFSGDYISAFSENVALTNLSQRTNDAGNFAAVNVKGIENISLLSQQGYNIIGVIDIDGNGNRASMRQSGNDLLSILSMKGNSNQFDLTQQGSGLQNYFKIYGSNTNFEAHQTNYGMRLEQAGGGGIPLSIQQTGVPTPIIIRNN